MAVAGYTNIRFSSQTEAPDCRLSGSSRILLHSIIRLGCGVYLYSVSVLASYWQFFASRLLVLPLPAVLLVLCLVLQVLYFAHSSPRLILPVLCLAPPALSHRWLSQLPGQTMLSEIQ